jgi:hypothetical protein
VLLEDDGERVGEIHGDDGQRCCVSGVTRYASCAPMLDPTMEKLRGVHIALDACLSESKMLHLLNTPFKQLEMCTPYHFQSYELPGNTNGNSLYLMVIESKEQQDASMPTWRHRWRWSMAVGKPRDETMRQGAGRSGRCNTRGILSSRDRGTGIAMDDGGGYGTRLGISARASLVSHTLLRPRNLFSFPSLTIHLPAMDPLAEMNDSPTDDEAASQTEEDTQVLQNKTLRICTTASSAATSLWGCEGKLHYMLLRGHTFLPSSSVRTGSY